MRALGLALVALAAGCPDEVRVQTHIDGHEVGFPFRRAESLLGQAFALALCHELYSTAAGGCDGLCAAQALADRARALFAAGGCAPAALEGRFDVLQVGAHVGDSRDYQGRSLDPIHGWLRAAPAHASALLVEPVRASFEALVANARGSRADVSYLHAALVPAARPEPAHIFDAEPGRGSTRADLSLIASLDAGLIEGHVSRNATGDAVVRSLARRPVAAYDWAQLRAAYAPARLGFLAVDAEALDCQLLLAFPFHALRPHVVQFEHAHCDGAFSRDADPGTWILLNRTRGLLAAYGYEVANATHAGDATFVRADALPRVDAAFAAARPGLYANGRCKQPFLRWGVPDPSGGQAWGFKH